MRLIVVSRIDKDKDFFNYYLNIVKQLKKEGIIYNILFIGSIDNINVYNKIIDYAKNNNLENLITFTQKSMPYEKMPNETGDIYLNISIGYFVGYSSIECLQNSFTTVFLNGDSTITMLEDSLQFSRDTEALYQLLKNIYIDKSILNKLKEENRTFYKSYSLSKDERSTLSNLLYGKI